MDVCTYARPPIDCASLVRGKEGREGSYLFIHQLQEDRGKTEERKKQKEL